MTVTAKDFVGNAIEWTCYYCNQDRTFRAGKTARLGADPCPVCGELRKPYVYPTKEQMEAAGCLPAPIVAVFKPNPEYLKPAGFSQDAPPRVLRVIPPTNVGYHPNGSPTHDWDSVVEDDNSWASER
jgi:hypothetical protein